MQRKSVVVAAVAALCILALASAAATIDSTEEPGGDGVRGAATETGSGADDNSTESAYEPGNPLGSYGDRITDRLESILCVPVLTEPPVVLAILGLVVAGFVVVKRKHDLITAIGMLTVLVAPGVALGAAYYYTSLGCHSIPSPRGETGNVTGRMVTPTGGGGGAGEASTQVAPEPSVLMIGIVVVAVAAAAAVLVRGTGDDVSVPAAEFDDDDALARPPGPVIAEVAGAAADRIEATGEVENEVYSAWREMTTHLEVANSGSSTPAEFRRAAVDAGMDREPVDQLTAVFEDVRYGGYGATPEREREAVEALRRIEDAYGDGKP